MTTTSNSVNKMTSLFDDIEEDHFLVRRHLHRCSFNEGESLIRNRSRTPGSIHLLHNPQMSSVARKPILYPPGRRTETEPESSPGVRPVQTADDKKLERADETLEGRQSSFEANQQLDRDSSSQADTEESISGREVDSKSFLCELSPLSRESNSNNSKNVGDNVDSKKNDTTTDNNDSDNNDAEDNVKNEVEDGKDRQVSSPDSLEEMEELKRIHETRKNQLEEGEFKVDDVGTPLNSSFSPSSPSSPSSSSSSSPLKSHPSRRMSKIISYDEALNIPQTDDDKQRLSTSRRSDRPSNLLLLVHGPVQRPTSARASSRKASGHVVRRAGFVGSMQSLNSSSLGPPATPRTPRSDGGSFLTSEADRQELLRRTQSFRGSRSVVAGSRRATLGTEMINYVQENAKTLSSTFEYLSPKDQKVLAVLMAKREREKEEERLKEEMKSLWEAEKHVKSRQSLFQVPSDLHLRCGHKSQEECINESCPIFRSLTLEEKKQLENRMKLQQALERKKRVEQRLEEQKRKMEEHSRELLERQQKELERATSSKRERSEQIKQKMSRHNEATKQKLEQIKNKQLSERELSNMEENLKATLSAAELKAKKLRDEEATKIAKKLQMKIERAHQIQRSMEEELKVWQEQAVNYRLQQDKQAEVLQATQKAQRKESLARSREAKERAQRENLQRILAREKERRESIEASIVNKEERTKLLNQEKESLMQKSRAQAQLTRRLREELKFNQSLTDLDKLSKYVDLQRKILR